MKRTKVVFVFAFFAILCLASIGLAREWSSATGTFKTEAEFVSFENGNVQLKKPNGDVITVPIAKLSEKDRSFLRKQKEVAEYFGSHPELDPGVPEFATISAPDDFRHGLIRQFDKSALAKSGLSIYAMEFSRDGGILIMAGTKLLLVDLDKSRLLNEPVRLVPTHVTCAVVSPDGSRLLLGGHRGKLLVFEIDGQGGLKPFSQFDGHKSQINCVAVSSDGKHALSGGRDQMLKYWVIETGKELLSMEGHKFHIDSCHLTSDGKQALSADINVLMRFNLADGKQLQSKRLVSKLPVSENLDPNDINVDNQGVDISPDGKKVAVTTTHFVFQESGVKVKPRGEYQIKVWDTTEGDPVALEVELEQDSIQFSADGKRIITCDKEKINVWDLASAKRICSFDRTRKIRQDLTFAFSPDNRHFAAAEPGNMGVQVFRIPEPDE